jgi:cell division protein FtsI (penicillin-binding protein 3)
MGLIPANKPVLSITVIIEESKGAIYGGVVSAPIFREIAGQALRVLGYYPQPDKTDSTLAKNKPAAPQPAAAPKPEIIPLREASVIGTLDIQKLAAPQEPPCGPLKVMPDLRGMNIRRAMKILNQSGVRCRTQGSGLAVSQQPSPGAPLEPDTICVVKFEPHS